MSDYKLTHTDHSLIISYPPATQIQLFQLYPGILLAFNHVSSRKLPLLKTPSVSAPFLLINATFSGICELTTEAGNYVYVKAGTLCLSAENSANGYSYPTGSYDGIEIYLQPSCLTESAKLLKTYQIDPDQIIENYCMGSAGSVMISAPDLLKEPFESLENLKRHDMPDISLLRIYTLLILRLLSSGAASLNGDRTGILTPHQVRMAKEAEKTLTGNLSVRIPVRKIAAEMKISESSLKNYFRCVYGKNISAYLLEKRVAKAKELLDDTALPILEIAQECGYENHGKFSAIFLRETGFRPSAYRRRNR